MDRRCDFNSMIFSTFKRNLKTLIDFHSHPSHVAVLPHLDSIYNLDTRRVTSCVNNNNNNQGPVHDLVHGSVRTTHSTRGDN